MSAPSTCFVCRKPMTSPFMVCLVCEGAGIQVVVCSPRCRRVHLRDGRHRKELKAR